MKALAPTIKQLLSSPPSHSVTVTGYIKSIRRQKNLTFAQISDGTSSDSLQAVFKHNTVPAPKDATFGANIRLTGSLIPSKGPGQPHDLSVSQATVLGPCDPETYPLQKQEHSNEFLRDHLHLRPRTSTIASMLRLRDSLQRLLGSWFHSHDFTHIHTPILTSSDAEGAGESFRIAPIPSTSSSSSPVEFFSRPAHLTVSAQLHLEAFQSALSRVYTLSPCFRAEASQTNRHLAEFWMLEAEWGLSGEKDDVHSLCDFVEGMLRHLLFCSIPDPEHELQRYASGRAWPHITYSEAISILQDASLEDASVTFEFPPTPGHALQSEHERYLADTYFEGPVFVTDCPAALKPFYMRMNDFPSSLDASVTSGFTGPTVACFDLLVPRIGELAGGSVREERYEVLRERLQEAGLIHTNSSSGSKPESDSDSPMHSYGWYLSLREHSTSPHGGFGLGFERLVQWVGDIENVREAVGMPRWVGRMGL